jgi:hypothetical protein
MSGWTDQRTRGAQSRVVSYLPSSQPKCKPSVNLYGYDSDRPRTDRVVPKGKNTTISLGRQAKSIETESDAQHRAVEFSECGHKIQRLHARPDELAQRSPERCPQTSVTSIAHRDLYAGGIEAVLRRQGGASLGTGGRSSSRQQRHVGSTSGTPVGAGEAKRGNFPADNDDAVVPPLEELAGENWNRPRVDPDKIRDPYLRQQGLHINDPGVYSHISKQLVSSRSLTKAVCDKTVDFNFQYVRKI